MKWFFFIKYNDIYDYTDGYVMGEYPGNFRGWIGLWTNLKYVLPLFSVTTTKWVSINMKRDLIWQVYWDFFLDAGAALKDTPDYDDYRTSDFNNLHLYPALGIGTSIRVVPSFIPLQVRVSVGVDFNLRLKEKSISINNPIIEIAIEDVL